MLKETYTKERKIRLAQQKALNQLGKDELQSVRLFAKLRARIHEATPEAIREAGDLEYELTGDMVATTLMGEALGLSDYCDCDCSEYYETLESGETNNRSGRITAVGHLPECKYYEHEDLGNAPCPGCHKTTCICGAD